MGAPEKIYLHPDLDSIFGMAERSCENEIEYTRTDVFIEKAVKFMCNCIEDEMARHLETWHPDMKVKTIERFKNYMKRE